MKLTAKQQKFVDYYCSSGNATQAAIKAGYSEKTAKSVGSENLTKPDIAKAIEERSAQLESERIADMSEIKQFWTETMRSDYEEVKDRIKASELLAKTMGAFIDRHEHSGVDGQPIKTETTLNLSNLSDKELEALETIISKSTESGSD